MLLLLLDDDQFVPEAIVPVFVSNQRIDYNFTLNTKLDYNFELAPRVDLNFEIV